MSQQDNYTHLAFNRGLLSTLGLGRIDLKRTVLSAEIQTNWIPRVLGSAMFRPGLAYKGTTNNNEAAVHIPFVFSLTDKAVLEFTEDTLRIRISDVVLTRPTVASAVTNGSFAADITTGWTDSDEAGAVSSWAAGSLAMLGNSTGTAFCKQDQQVTVAAGDIGVEHALRLTVGRGPVEIKVGSAQGGQEYFGYSLGTGVHSLSFTPTGNFWIRIQSRESYTVLLADVNVEAAGAVELPTDRDNTDLSNIRHDQSGDVVFIACKDKPQTKVERRSTRSWSWVIYEANYGPFLIRNLETTTLVPSALNGNVTLTASAPVFEASHVGALFSINSSLQNVNAVDIAVENTFSDPINVIGITDSRIFVIEIAGIATGVVQSEESLNIAAQDTWTANILVTDTETSRKFKIVISDLADSTVTLQKSATGAAPWTDVDDWVADTSEYYDDGLTGNMYYRLGVKTGEYGTDGCDVSLLFNSPSTVTLQRSISEPGTWVDVKDWVADTIETYDDGLDNQNAYYRAGIKAGDYGTDVPSVGLLIESGSITGICRITAVATNVSASAVTLQNFGSATVASSAWSEGQ